MRTPTHRPNTSRRRHPVSEALTAAGLLFLGAACTNDIPTIAQAPVLGDLPSFAPPSSCGGQVNLLITMAEGPGGTQAIRGDAVANTYLQGGPDGVAAHLSSANGNLMLSLLNAPTRRYSWGATLTAGGPVSGSSNDRLYTNSHANPGGNNACGLAGMLSNSTGFAVFEAELLAGSNNADMIRYGKSCSGAALNGERVTTARSMDGNSWTITGTTGRYCTKGAKNKLQEAGTAGSFTMTLVRQ